MSTKFNCQKHFYFKLFSLFKQLKQFSLEYKKKFYFKEFSLARICRLNVKTFQSQAILFNISTQFKSQNSSISSNSVQHMYTV